jgi:hypothetical protein
MNRITILLASALIVGLCGVAEADLFVPEGEGNPFYLPAIPAHLVPTYDGDLSDWAFMPDQYVYTSDFFATLSGGIWSDAEAAVPKDDWDIIIYGPAWIPSMNMVTFAAHIVDDLLYAPFEDLQEAWQEEGMQFATDADHGHDPKEDSQEYQQNFFTPKQGGHVGLFGDEQLWWEFEEPYCFWGVTLPPDAGSPAGYDFEIAIALWDHLDPAGPEASTRHMMEAGQIIGFSIEAYDADGEADPVAPYEFPDVEFDWGNTAIGGEVLANWELLSVEDSDMPETAVESSTWGAIKATFTE